MFKYCVHFFSKSTLSMEDNVTIFTVENIKWDKMFIQSDVDKMAPPMEIIITI